MKCLITGTNKGIGKALCHLFPSLLDLDYLLLSRSKEDFQTIKTLSDTYPRSSFKYFQVDLSDREQTKSMLSELEFSSPISLLVNNAGVFLDKPSCSTPTNSLNVSSDTLMKTFEVNVRAPYDLIQAILPGMRQTNFGRIVNVSSGMSRIDEYDEIAPAYRASKRALNGITQSVAHLVRDDDITCNSVCPGWVRSSMGGELATRSCEEACYGIIQALLSCDKNHSGKFFRDDRELSFENTTPLDHYDTGLPPNLAEKVKESAKEFYSLYLSKS